MKQIFDNLSATCSRVTTNTYSTSFSLGIYFLNKRFHAPIYAIYGFVRFADEIVDSFHSYDKRRLLDKFKADTYEAIEQKISLNPILNSFQQTVNQYNIERELIDTFLASMEMDLDEKIYNPNGYQQYILGSAEVVGLMCLRVFTNGDQEEYEKLKPAAMKLGAAFQKVNFLRDLKDDFEGLGRTYFPGVDMSRLTESDKKRIEEEISEDFREALQGIRNLPSGARQGVYLAYVYYNALFKKIKGIPVERVMKERIRIPNRVKFGLMVNSILRNRVNMI